MSNRWHNPLETILSAMASTIGWAVTVPCLVYMGILAGCVWGNPDQCLSMSLGFMALLPVAWIVCPIIIPAYFVIPLAIWWPLKSESRRSFIAAAVITFLTWTLASLA